MLCGSTLAVSSSRLRPSFQWGTTPLCAGWRWQSFRPASLQSGSKDGPKTAPRARRRWTKEEGEVLLKGVRDGQNASRIAAALGRTALATSTYFYRSLFKGALRLELQSSGSVSSEQEKAILLMRSGGKSWKQIATALGLPLLAVQRRYYAGVSPKKRYPSKPLAGGEVPRKLHTWSPVEASEFLRLKEVEALSYPDISLQMQRSVSSLRGRYRRITKKRGDASFKTIAFLVPTRASTAE